MTLAPNLPVTQYSTIIRAASHGDPQVILGSLMEGECSYYRYESVCQSILDITEGMILADFPVSIIHNWVDVTGDSWGYTVFKGLLSKYPFAFSELNTDRILRN